MAIPTEQKKQIVADVRQRLQEAGSIYLIEFPGLSVAQISDLRGRLIEAGSRLYVIKNRLLLRALEGSGFEALAEHLTGPNAATFCGDDPVGPLKVLTEFLAERGMPPVKTGLVDGKLLTDAELKRLSAVLSREQLIASVVGGFAAPITEFVLSLSALVSDLVYTLQAVADKRGEQSAA
ncbi:MAG TPA: 50S ribosomal protein L10 [Armatimonadota bacterium]|nr:50S ribosomal protein L10 [Armatimonadota bacterium]